MIGNIDLIGSIDLIGALLRSRVSDDALRASSLAKHERAIIVIHESLARASPRMMRFAHHPRHEIAAGLIANIELIANIDLIGSIDLIGNIGLIGNIEFDWEHWFD